MIRFFKVAFVFIMSLTIFSCSKADDPVVTYVVPFAEQYPRDLAAIDKYLDEYHMDVNSDKDVTFTKIPTPNTANLQTIRAQYASNLHTKTVNSNGVDYKVYYINTTDLSDPANYGAGEKPTVIDSAFVSYKGSLLDETVFDQAQNPVWFRLYQYGDLDIIRGWKEIFPLFKAGDKDVTDINNPIYTNFGAGVMFLPSGLAYYSGSGPTGSLPSYSPLIFSFKLKDVNYVDHDADRIDSRYEDANGDGDPTNDDSDGDGHIDALDIDDDADGIPTKTEIKNPSGGYYSFASIPLCTDGKKKHLSAACH
ncbi:hypothetical protein SAMN05660845_0274 [Flavobacterium swingsii]|jgi:FKBP-type peptidyl-prolyl cis-trans isomerase FkpA|uniref:Peptidyl-prolyl cis-trans isomerase n=1 Tax=Flavobacterium swingsii TaxID=498292 RepID=A0A1I0V9V4_9FLAO|nr:FKBP-type peptidyl-prolyl cis-trans isomerase [Flavobacterium swingsii]SFA73169.1 hypothetical protein SAMN05660845_0274 [Flavobacterium swingsii]